MQQHPGFFDRAGPFPLHHLATELGAELRDQSAGSFLIHDIKSLVDAGSAHLTFCDNRRYLAGLATTHAGACLLPTEFATQAPATSVVLITKAPQRAFARALELFYSDASRAKSGQPARVASALVHPTARLGLGVTIEPGAVVGPESTIGEGTFVSSGAVIGFRVRIGRDGFIGPGVSITHALIGDRAVIHAGVRIGQDGFGFAMGAQGHAKIPQIGRAIIGDDVEIGANSTVDRGALADTKIGDGTKIDNLVQVAHNVVIGKHCVIVSHCAIAGSATLGDFVVLGGCVGIKDHVKVGSGAQVAAMSGVIQDIPPGAKYGGWPARPVKEWAREVAALRRLAARSKPE